MAIRDWKGRTAVITGASSGIGAAAARRLAREGLRVVLAARREERLKLLAAEICAAGGQADYVCADLTREEDRALLFETVLDRYGGADALFNNAGAAWYGNFCQQPWEVARELLEINVMATTHLTSLFLEPMKRRGSGHIINMGSIVGGLPVQGTAIYGSSKAYLNAFSTILGRELTGSGVHVSVIRAGPVKTDFFATTGARREGHPLPGEAWAIPVEWVADAVWRLLNHPRRVVYLPGYMSAIPLVNRLFGWIIDRVGPVLIKDGRLVRG